MRGVFLQPCHRRLDVTTDYTTMQPTGPGHAKHDFEVSIRVLQSNDGIAIAIFQYRLRIVSIVVQLEYFQDHLVGCTANER